MTIRKPLKPWMIASAFAVITAASPGCKSNALNRHQHAAAGIPAPTTSSAVTDVPASVVQQGQTAYDTGVKRANEAYEDVNQLATKAANDLKSEARQTQADLTQSARNKASAMKQAATQTAKDTRAAVGTRAQQATDDLLNAIGPKDAEGVKAAADDPVVLPDPSTAQP